MVDMAKAAVTNQRVADALNISDSMVSRIRSGDRRPSIAVMLVIADVFGWSAERQMVAWSIGQYDVAFEGILAEHYDG